MQPGNGFISVAEHLQAAKGQSAPPSLEEFLAAPIGEIRKVAPATMILGAGGTRRRAVLAGISPQSEEYAQWTQQQMVASFDLIFEHGVQHLIALIFISSHHHETTPDYREKLGRWATWALAGDKSLAYYERKGWRVRMIGQENWPELVPVAAKLVEATSLHAGPTLWYSVASHPEKTWTRLLEIAVERRITDRADLVRAFYGEEIPPATLYLGTGKPQVEDSQIPALLAGKLECYWRQHLGYDLDALTLRRILYDFAYVRPTWQADKSNRAEQVTAFARAWENPPIVGLGQRLGPFWFPVPIVPVSGGGE